MVEMLDVLHLVRYDDAATLLEVLETPRVGPSLDVPEVLVLTVLLGREELAVEVLPVQIRDRPWDPSAPSQGREKDYVPHLYWPAISTNSLRRSIMSAPRQKSLGIFIAQVRPASYASVLSCTSRNEPTPGSGQLKNP